MRKKISVIAVFLLCLQAMIIGLPTAEAASSVTKQFKVSPGVDYKHVKESTNQAINLLEINLKDPHTSLEVGFPNPLNKTMTTTAAANANSYDGHRVVGAINASFFDMSTKFPMYLLAKDNQIINGGLISEGKDKYVNEPIAFGINRDGLAEIDDYQFQIQASFKGQTVELSGLNRLRDANEAILFSPSSNYTNSNAYGIEYVITSDQTVQEPLQFGDVLTGKVTAIRPYGDKTNTKVPANGFVLSINGSDQIDTFKSLQIGDTVSTTLSINEKWQQAKYMMASGPMLVKNGKVFLTIDPNSSRAKERAPRTAVAIDQAKSKVYFVTVDGRQPGYSTGMSLPEFANYLVSLGVDRAINLDGGGSTAMALRNYGSNQAVLINRPSDGRERAVSTTLQAISTAPLGEPTYLRFTPKQSGKILVGSTVEMTPHYVLDQYYNTLSYDSSKFAFSVSNQVGTMNGSTFTAKQAGESKIIGQYGNASRELPITVVDKIDRFAIQSGSLNIEAGKTKELTVSVKDANDQPIIYQPSQLKWSVSGDIGTMNGSTFVAGEKSAKGTISATLGKSTVSIPVTVTTTSKEIKFHDVSDSYWAKKEITYLAGQGIISGYPTGDFKPGDKLTRAHAAILLARALKLDTTNSTNPGFKDVPTSHRYYSIIAAVANKGIMGGKEGGIFDPEGKLTRAQMAVILQNAYKLQGMPEKDFKDVKPDYWAYKAIGSLAYNEITTGYQDNTFQPGNTVTRAQYSAFLYRILTK